MFEIEPFPHYRSGYGTANQQQENAGSVAHTSVAMRDCIACLVLVCLFAGIVAGHGHAEPRLGVAYHVKPSNTVLRVSYARLLETPFNENLVLASTGCNFTVVADLIPCVPATNTPGYRNEFHAGLEQAFGRHLVVSGDYIWKYTHTGYDFSVLEATPLTFPIGWHHSKIPGFDLAGAYRIITGLRCWA
jgi:hypothetical protein